MVAPTPVTQQYYNFKDFPILSPSSVYAMSPAGQSAVSALTTWMTSDAITNLFNRHRLR